MKNLDLKPGETIFQEYAKTDEGMLGCDGAYHALWPWDTGLEGRLIKNVGPCNESCTEGIRKGSGGFAHTPPTE